MLSRTILSEQRRSFAKLGCLRMWRDWLLYSHDWPLLHFFTQLLWQNLPSRRVPERSHQWRVYVKIFLPFLFESLKTQFFTCTLNFSLYFLFLYFFFLNKNQQIKQNWLQYTSKHNSCTRTSYFCFSHWQAVMCAY